MQTWADRIGRRLKLRDLHILMEVVQWRNMTKAAQHLAVSTPVVSKTIADMEHMLGVSLLDRTPKGVEPTIYGQALLKGGVTVFDELRQRVHEIEFLKDPTAGELRIGATTAPAAGLLPAVIERLIRQYPRIVFHVTVADPAVLQYRELRDRTIEFAIGRIAGPSLESDMNAETLIDDRIYVVAGSNSRWARRRRIELVELLNERWALPPFNSPRGPLIVEAFRAKGLDPPQPSVVSFSIELNTSLLATGLFLGILPGYMLRLSAKHLPIKILPVEIPSQPSPVMIVTLKNRTLSPVAKLFINCARDVARSLVK